MKNQTIKFLIVGVLNTIVGFAVYAGMLLFLKVNYSFALLVSHVIGVIHSYIWNNKWTFGVKDYNLRSMMKFILVYTLTFFVNLLLLSIFIHQLGINKFYAQAISLFITTLISFFGHKYWSFKASKNS
ncbi:hypothetical protein AMQ83_18695 [Paenibacillus riograndensis]|nr:hypothetical protein AMQ83_18695 [Paenibacillus riograndensis]